jgi:antitoxin ParD1/3/4
LNTPDEDTAMNVNLTPQLEEMVREKVASGRYNNASEVIREALRLLADHERIRYEAFKAAVNKGFEELDRGEVILLTVELREEIKREALALARQGRKPNPDVCP